MFSHRQKKRMSHGGAEDFGLANQLEIAEQVRNCAAIATRTLCIQL